MDAKEKVRLQKIIRGAQQVISNAEDAERIAKNKKFVGKCFRSRNSYSGGNPGWWNYRKITGVDKDGNLLVLTFEDDTEGRINIHRDNYYHDGYLIDCHPITNYEFKRQWKLLMTKITNNFI